MLATWGGRSYHADITSPGPDLASMSAFWWEGAGLMGSKSSQSGNTSGRNSGVEKGEMKAKKLPAGQVVDVPEMVIKPLEPSPQPGVDRWLSKMTREQRRERRKAQDTSDLLAGRFSRARNLNN